MVNSIFGTIVITKQLAHSQSTIDCYPTWQINSEDQKFHVSVQIHSQQYMKSENARNRERSGYETTIFCSMEFKNSETMKILEATAT